MADKERLELLQGTLDMLILKSISGNPMHGFGISVRIRQMSQDVLQVEQGSLAECELLAVNLDNFFGRLDVCFKVFEAVNDVLQFVPDQGDIFFHRARRSTQDDRVVFRALNRHGDGLRNRFAISRGRRDRKGLSDRIRTRQALCRGVIEVVRPVTGAGHRERAVRTRRIGLRGKRRGIGGVGVR